MTQRGLKVTAEEFLTEFLKIFPKGARAWVATFSDAANPRWQGKAVTLAGLPRLNGRNCYYSTAAFPKGATNRYDTQMIGAGAVVIDDPTTKGDAAELFEKLGRPTYKIQTSADSYHWGYFLKEPASKSHIAPVLRRIDTLGLGDKNGNNAVRYVRLPCGINNKPEYDEVFRVRCESFIPQRRFGIEQIAKALGADVSTQLAEPEDETLVSERLDRMTDDELIEKVSTTAQFHDPMVRLIDRAVARGGHPPDIQRRFRGLMLDCEGLAVEKGRDASWKKTFDEIPRMVKDSVLRHPEAVVRMRLRRERGVVISDEENIRLILEYDKALMGLVRFDEFQFQRVLTRPIPGDLCVVAADGFPRRWRDEDTVDLQQYVQRQYIAHVGRDRVDGALGAWVRDRWAFHPIRDYLDGLEWDRTERLDEWLVTYMGARSAPKEYLAAVGSKWLVSAVARVMDPGCKADYMLVLEGPQGIKKTSALVILAGEAFFSDSLPHDLTHKDAKDHLRGKWIVEMSELSQFKKSEIETVKGFLTRQVERFRPAYGRHEIDYPRQCVFAGSTNDDQYLIDDTGNRRFWPVKCRNIRLVSLRRDRDQLWAEAHIRYLSGEKWYLDGDTEVLAVAQTEKRRLVDPWFDEIETALTTGMLKDADKVRPGDALTAVGMDSGRSTSFHAGRVGRIMRSLGWTKRSRYFVRPKGGGS